jgi:hypothetical protein
LLYFCTATQWSPEDGVTNTKHVEIVGDKYVYLPYNVRLVGIEISDFKCLALALFSSELF